MTGSAKISSLCVFCGASPGSNVYMELAHQTGALFAQLGIRLVYGGGSSGLMGAVANGCLEQGGKVTGIMPAIDSWREQIHQNLTELVMTENLHTRKRLMLDKSEAALVLPGGLGTLDEAVEAITWKSCGFHQKPIYILNHQGFFAPFFALVAHMRAQGFIRSEDSDLYTVVQDLATLRKLLCEW